MPLSADKSLVLFKSMVSRIYGTVHIHTHKQIRKTLNNKTILTYNSSNMLGQINRNYYNKSIINYIKEYIF